MIAGLGGDSIKEKYVDELPVAAGMGEGMGPGGSAGSSLSASTSSLSDASSFTPSGPIDGQGAAPPKPAPLSMPAPLKPLAKTKLIKPLTTVSDPSTLLSKIVPEEILLQLARESISGRQTELLRPECVKVVEESDQAILSYDSKLADEDKRRCMMQAVAAGVEFEIDQIIYLQEDKDSKQDIKYYNLTDAALTKAVETRPDRYKLATISLDQNKCVAHVIDPQDPVQCIHIEGMLLLIMMKYNQIHSLLYFVSTYF